MLRVSDPAMDSLREAGLRSLRTMIDERWRARLNRSGWDAGPAGRARVLDGVEAAARADPSLSIADLAMLADLMLVDAAAQARAR